MSNEITLYVKDKRRLLEAYADRGIAAREGVETAQWVDRVLAAVDLQVRRLARPVSPESVLLAVWTCLTIGLVPHGGVRGTAFLVPFAGHAQLIIGVRGWRELAARVGVKQLVTGIVCEGDEIHKAQVPPLHIPEGDPDLVDLWQYGYACGEMHSDGERYWLAPLWVSGTELKRRLEAARAKDRNKPTSKRGYAWHSPGVWALNRLCRAYCSGTRFAVTDPAITVARAGLADLSATLQAAAPDDALEIAGELAAATVITGEPNEEPPEDLSPAGRMAAARSE